jgi:hypothetical protein
VEEISILQESGESRLWGPSDSAVDIAEDAPTPNWPALRSLPIQNGMWHLFEPLLTSLDSLTSLSLISSCPGELSQLLHAYPNLTQLTYSGVLSEYRPPTFWFTRFDEAAASASPGRKKA